MEMNKRYVAGGYLISNQLQRAVANTLAQNWLIGLPPEFLGQYVPLIQKVTPEQVREIGKKYFAPENAVDRRGRRPKAQWASSSRRSGSSW
jgi:zinc protease